MSTFLFSASSIKKNQYIHQFVQSESSEPSTQTLDTEPRCLCLTIWNISLVLSLSPILEFFMHILTFKGDTVL